MHFSILHFFNTLHAVSTKEQHNSNSTTTKTLFLHSILHTFTTTIKLLHLFLKHNITKNYWKLDWIFLNSATSRKKINREPTHGIRFFSYHVYDVKFLWNEFLSVNREAARHRAIHRGSSPRRGMLFQMKVEGLWPPAIWTRMSLLDAMNAGCLDISEKIEREESGIRKDSSPDTREDTFVHIYICSYPIHCTYSESILWLISVTNTVRKHNPCLKERCHSFILVVMESWFMQISN